MLNKLSFLFHLTVSGFFLLLLSSCYNSSKYTSERYISFNYNVVVKSDSLMLLRQQPEERLLKLMTDSFIVQKDEHLVIADIRIVPNDSVDTVWVQVATEWSDFGWIHESQLLKDVVPDDPISQFISTFSDKHIIVFLIILSVIFFIYIIRRMKRQNDYIVHFNDIDSIYPTLLALLVALAATLYASIQNFAPDVWQHFYFHPTLNPFSVPMVLSIFLVLVWAMLIVGLAVLDDIRRRLPLDDVITYLFGLVGVCAINYVVFSITTLYYVGYFLLVLYIYFALRQYFTHHYSSMICGYCGQEIHSKGKCPHCGAINS